MRMRKKKNLLPRMEACGAWLVRNPFAQRGRWRELMPEAKEIRLELGCGKGRFTAGTAAAEPDVLLIAVEKVPDAMVVAMERCRDEDLRNVFFIDADAALLPDMFEPGEIDRIYINFCDPWPKSNQAKRRLTHHNFLNLYRKVLKDGGEIHFKTDNDKLFEWSVEEIPQYGWELRDVTRDLHTNGPVGVMTDYEKKFHELGKNINRCVAVMQPWEPAEENGQDEAEELWGSAAGGLRIPADGRLSGQKAGYFDESRRAGDHGGAVRGVLAADPTMGCLSGRAADLSFENGGVYGSRVGLYCAARAASRRGVQAADRAEADIRTDMERGLLRRARYFRVPEHGAGGAAGALCGVHRRFSAGGAADRRSGEPVYGRLSAGHPFGWMRRRFI